MNKPGNMPVDRWSERFANTAIVVAWCEMIAAVSGKNAVVLLAVAVFTLIISAIVCRARHKRRVRRYLSTVCTLFVLCLFAGCGDKCTPPEQSSAYLDRLKAIEAKLDACQPHEPTQVVFEQDHCDPAPE